MLERDFQRKLIQDIEERFEGCLVLKNDPTYIQGIPDLMILYKDRWAALEVKVSARSAKQPNQSYYIDRMSDMSYASFVFPENKEQVLDDLQRAFSTRRNARISKR